MAVNSPLHRGTEDAVVNNGVDQSKDILSLLPGKLPQSSLPADVEPADVARQFVASLPTLAVSQLKEHAIWRDTFALSGTMRTFYTDVTVLAAWQELIRDRGAKDFELFAPAVQQVKLDEQTQWIEGRFFFTAEKPIKTKCSGFLSICSTSDGGWKIWVIKTILEQIAGQADVDTMAPVGTPDGTVQAQINGSVDGLPYFDTVIVGGGMCGLATGGRLKALGVSYVCLEREQNLEDPWAKRYKSAKLHTVRNYAHMPFDRTFGPEFQEFLTKDEVAKGHADWAKRYGINVWLSTSLDTGKYDASSSLWILNITRDGRASQLQAKHLIFATGAGCHTPVVPPWADREKFGGKVIHSVNYHDADSWKGLRGIVVGAGNTGHDVASDMVAAGLSSVTMVQRSPTFVLPVENMMQRYKGTSLSPICLQDLPKLIFKTIGVYNDVIPTEISDRIWFSAPMSVGRLVSGKNFHRMAAETPERWEALAKAGFKADPFGDIQRAINVKLGGFYIDVGAGKLITDGQIKMKSDAVPVAYSETGLVFSDGSMVPADVIVLATGFLGNLKEHVSRLLGADVAERAGDCFGVDEEGELHGVFKPTGHPGLWYIGGGMGHSRYYSRFLALQIKADVMGTPFPVYSRHKHTL
ncbi:hypothetical protein DL763_007048 [Monosporascus cannonballus]|nr:hypothetical protein DL763_007048 [Monosporascus cannonballus]